MTKKNKKQINSYSSSFDGKVLKEGSSDYHQYRFVQNKEHGICLFLDGIIQSSSKDQKIYHESMVSQALRYFPKPQNILIIGGAGGGVLHQILKMSGDLIKKIDIVDIDKQLFELAPNFLKGWCDKRDFKDKRVKVTFEDGALYLKRISEKYDVIFLDISDPVSTTKSHELYTESVFRDICARLVDNGILVYHSAPFDAEDNIFYSCFRNYPLLVAAEHHSDKTYIASYEGSWFFNVIQKRDFIDVRNIKTV